MANNVNLARENYNVEGLNNLARDAELVYDMNYFTGSQVAIYVGDVWVDEVVHFQMALSQVKTPLYGYASELWDALARGPKLVRGTFTINFKEAGYLFAVLKHYKEALKGEKGILSPYKVKDKIMRANIEKIMSLPANDRRLYDYYSDMASIANELKKTEEGGEKSNLFDLFEDAIWSREATEKLAGRMKNFNTNTRSVISGAFGGFDIYIQFGDFTNELANHTIIKLEQVELVEQSMAVGADDEPILEVYGFIARNWI